MASINDLTISDQAEIEERTGQPMADLANPDKPKAKLMQWVAFKIKSKDDPKFSLADAGNLTLKEIGELIGDDQTPLDG